MPFFHLKSQHRIINIGFDDIDSVEFTPKDEEEEDDEATLVINEDLEITGKEAEKLYLELIKRLPDLITIS